MRPKVKPSPSIIYLLITFEGGDYTLKAELEVLTNTELYFISVDQPVLKQVSGDFFLIWRLSNGQFKYIKNNQPRSNAVKQAVVDAISKLITD